MSSSQPLSPDRLSLFHHVHYQLKKYTQMLAICYLIFMLTFVSTSAGHGIIKVPTARPAGAAMKAACGQQITNNLQSNAYGPIEQLQQMSTSEKDFTSGCDLTLCKGMQFDDNAASIQKFASGQVVPITVDIQAKHTGTANVSIVDTVTNTMIGDELIYFPVYASTATEIPKNQTQFSITMPDVASECGAAGACVLQWWWNSKESSQTYMSCIDFTMS